MTPAAGDPSTEFSIQAAAAVLERGGLVAFPTETVYGLGADAENPQAVDAIYSAKGRPANHPLIVHLAPNVDPGYWSSSVNSQARKLISAFWPGPLTLILPRHAGIADVAAGGQDTIGLRCPAHPVAQALLQAFKAGRGGIAAPSANRFGRVSPTTALHVWEEFADSALVTCVLDGGQSSVGIESTILGLTGDYPVLLRPGSISALQIAELLGIMPATPGAMAPRVSGSLASHYAPHTPVAIVPSGELPEVCARLVAACRRVALMHHTPCANVFSATTPAAIYISDPMTPMLPMPTAGSITGHCMPSDPNAYAHDLYAVLRQLDHVAADIILVEEVPGALGWSAVGDRVGRAAHGSNGVLERLLEAP